MIIACRIGTKYELGCNITVKKGSSGRKVIPITKEEYDKLAETRHEDSHHEQFGFIMISEDAGFTKDEIDALEESVKDFYNDNKIKTSDSKS